MRKLLSIVASALAAVVMFSCEEAVEPAGLTVAPETLSFKASAANQTVDISSALAWTAQVSEGGEWVSLSATSGEGNSQITVSVATNATGANRSASVTFKSGDESAVLAIEQTGSSVETPEGVIVPEPIYRPDIFSPVDYVADCAEGGMDGVTIEITRKETNNFVFEVRPGANIQSYRMDVYPLCRLYNSIYESARQGGMDMNKQLSADVIETMIRGYIFDNAGAGAFTFSIDNLEDYMNHEFDWMNSGYAQAKIVPDCEYIVAAVGCFDAEGTDQGDLSLCYVRTPYKSLIGQPEVGIDVITSYDAMQVTYVPNDDCKYFYQWVSNAEDLKPYIEIYGDKLYADFMRNAVYQPTSREDVDNHRYYISFGLNASAEVPIMATAIGLDKNYTPAEEFQSEEFYLKQRPETTGPAESTITIDEEHLGAGIFWVNVELGANCSAAVMKVLPKEEADAVMAGDDASKEAYARFVYQDGWGFSNQNYLYNRETDELLGSSYSMKDVWTGSKPDTEYVIIWTAMNQYRELAPLQCTESFRTLPIVLDNPSASEENVVLNLSHTGVQRVNIEFVYDFEKAANIHFQYIEGFETYGASVPTPESSREDLLAFLYQAGDIEMGAPSANHWWTVPAGIERWTDILNPNTTYTIAYVAEDWNGVMGEVKFATTKTDPLQGGENPQATITGGFTMTDNVPYFQFDMGQDAMQLYYMSSSDDALNFRLLGDKRKLRYKDIQPAWENYCMEYALKTYAMSSKQQADHGDIALCIPVGGTADAPIFGSLEHLIFADDDGDGTGEFRNLGYYYPDEYAADQASSVSPLRQQLIKSIMRPTQGMKASELPEVETGVRTVRYGKVSEDAIVINLDYDKFSSHPKASGK